MSLPRTTAESSLYRSSGHYRLLAGGMGTNSGVHLADSCMDDCMAECTGDSATCRFECRAQCGPRPPACEPGYQWCFGTGGHRTCCPESTNCCVHYDRPSLRELLSCCEAGQECCYPYGGCYDPRLQQCTPSGIWNCPSDRALCLGICCEVGQVCTPQWCTAPEQVCHGNRCVPGERCTPQGCCPEIRITRSGNCCPLGQVSDVTKDQCCTPGWSRTSQGCCPPGECCETVPCPQGKRCCQNLWCCNIGDECTTDPDNPCRTPFT
jgi:hypothetical protein